VDEYIECIDTVKRVGKIVKSINKHWPLYNLADYIYLLVRATSPCLVDFDVTDATTLVIMVKHRDGTVVGEVHAEGEVTMDEDTVFFKPVNTYIVEKGEGK
jgi:hypothetical protein